MKNIAVPSGEGRSLLVLPGETITFKAVSADTDGAYTLIEVIDGSNGRGSPPSHGLRTGLAFSTLVSLNRSRAQRPRQT
ncbi:hypothetical protein [Nostoc sp.]|uniref:hypothetical protein n=1 Tax=Nostoc sp. TaxID=1180 RepID=UPI002FF8A497